MLDSFSTLIASATAGAVVILAEVLSLRLWAVLLWIIAFLITRLVSRRRVRAHFMALAKAQFDEQEQTPTPYEHRRTIEVQGVQVEFLQNPTNSRDWHYEGYAGETMVCFGGFWASEQPSRLERQLREKAVEVTNQSVIRGLVPGRG